jgi:hypothetical protein
MQTGTLTIPRANLASHYGAIATSNAGAFDLAASDKHRRTLDGTNGALTLSNAQVGQTFLLILVQDTTGGRVVTSWWPGIVWFTSDGNPPAPASGANKRTVLTFAIESAGVSLGFVSGVQP